MFRVIRPSLLSSVDTCEDFCWHRVDFCRAALTPFDWTTYDIAAPLRGQAVQLVQHHQRNCCNYNKLVNVLSLSDCHLRTSCATCCATNCRTFPCKLQWNSASKQTTSCLRCFIAAMPLYNTYRTDASIYLKIRKVIMLSFKFVVSFTVSLFSTTVVKFSIY